MAEPAQQAGNGRQMRTEPRPRQPVRRRVRADPAAAGGPDGPWPADRVSRRPLGDLLPSARNARIHTGQQIEQIAASIREFGFTVPILVDEKGEVIAGHGRLMAAQMIGLDEVPVMTARGWTASQVRAYRLADNQLALNAAWDTTLLAAELRDLPGLESLIGFSSDQIAELFRVVEPPADFQALDETIPTEHCCPRCGFRWSGADRPKEDASE
jgi:ParB-like nuclease family protein